jgi:hypothetical protein
MGGRGTHEHDRQRAARWATTALAASLLVSGAAAPALAVTGPAAVTGVVSTEVTPQQALERAVAEARAAHRVALAEARTARSTALATPRAERNATLAAATTRTERRAAKLAYARAAAPVQGEYLAAARAAAATRDAAIEQALATFLLATGRADLVPALQRYEAATTKARAALALALQSSRATFRTDTADERTLLLSDLEQAETELERRAAWAAFVAGSTSERLALESSVAAARSTYYSAMRQARATFRAETGVTVRSLLRASFGR